MPFRSVATNLTTPVNQRRLKFKLRAVGTEEEIQELERKVSTFAQSLHQTVSLDAKPASAAPGYYGSYQEKVAAQQQPDVACGGVSLADVRKEVEGKLHEVVRQLFELPSISSSVGVLYRTLQDALTLLDRI